MLCLACLVLGGAQLLVSCVNTCLQCWSLRLLLSILKINLQLFETKHFQSQKKISRVAISTAEQNRPRICPLTVLTDVLPNIRMKAERHLDFNPCSLFFLCPFIGSNVYLQFPACVSFTLFHTRTWMCLSLQGLEMRQIRFRFDGQPINETDTPAQVSWKAQKGKVQVGGPDRSVRRLCDRLELASQPPARFLAFC